MERTPSLVGNDALPVVPPPARSERANWFDQVLTILDRGRLKPVAYSFADQALAVGGGFLVNVALARAQTKEEYGLFALSYSVYALLLALYSAMVLEPYMVYGSGRYRERFAEYLRLMIWSNLVIGISLTALLLLTCWLLSLAAPHFASRALWGLALTAGVILSGHLLRRAFYLQRQAVFAAKTSLVFFITVACSLWLVGKSNHLDGFSVFVILAVGWITAGAAFGRKLALGKPGRPFLQIEPNYWREHWNYTKWVLATAVVFQFTTQAYYWLVAGFLSAKEAGELRAMYMLVSPMDQMFIALSFLVIPPLSARYASKNIGRFLHIWKRYVLATFGVAGAFALAVRIMGRQVLHAVYAGKYDDLVPYLFVLAFLPVLTGIGSTINNAVIATEKPKLVFVAYLCSGAATFLGGILLVRRFGLRGSVYGMLLSAATFTGALALAFFFLMRRELAGSPHRTEENGA